MIEASLRHLLYNPDKCGWWGTGWKKAEFYSPTSFLKANLHITYMLIVLIPSVPTCHDDKELKVRCLINDIE